MSTSAHLGSFEGALTADAAVQELREHAARIITTAALRFLCKHGNSSSSRTAKARLQIKAATSAADAFLGKIGKKVNRRATVDVRAPHMRTHSEPSQPLYVPTGFGAAPAVPPPRFLT